MAKDILFIDQDPLLREMVIGELENKPEFVGCRFHFCTNAHDAQFFLEWHPKTAVIVVDLCLDGMEGLSLVSALKQKNRFMQVIVVSDHPDMAGIQQALSAGAMEFLSKPVNILEFSRTLKKALGQAESLMVGEEFKSQVITMRKDLEIAAQIQQSILPEQFPNNSMCELYARTQPARVVGGDFYDYYQITNTRIGFVLGDASGKGVPAAIFMAACQAFLRSLVDFFPDPGELLGALNRQLCQMNHSDYFATIFYGVFDTRFQQIEYALGGHPPPFIIREDGRLQSIPVNQRGTLVGVFPDAQFVTQSIPFHPGDSLVGYSDGVVKMGDEISGFMGEERFKDYIRLLAGASCKELVDDLFASLALHTHPGAMVDDRTLLALRSTARKKAGLWPNTSPSKMGTLAL